MPCRLSLASMVQQYRSSACPSHVNHHSSNPACTRLSLGSCILPYCLANEIIKEGFLDYLYEFVSTGDSMLQSKSFEIIERIDGNRKQIVSIHCQ